MSERTISRQRAWQLRKQQQGLCIHCGRRPRDGKSYCTACAESRNARRRIVGIDIERKTA